PVRTLLVLSLSYLLIYTSYNGIQNIQSSINDKGGLGVITLASVYIMMVLFSPLATSIIRQVGSKTILLIQWVCIGLFIGANFYPNFYTLIPTSLLVGACSACTGAIGSLYLVTISDSYIVKNKLTPDRRHVILSIIFGVFFTFFESTQITGNLFSSLVLFIFSSQPTANATASDKVCGAQLCSGTSTNGSSSEISHPSQDTLYLLFGIFLGCVLLGFLLTLTLLPQLKLPQEKSSLCHEIGSCFRTLAQVRCALLAPVIMAQGMMVMIMYTGFTQAFVSCSMGVEWVGFVMMAYGASTAMFATVANYLARYLGRVVLMITFIVVDSGLLVTMLLWTPGHGQVSTIIIFSMAVAEGVSEGISQPQFNSIVSIVFRENLPPAFVVYYMIKCLSFSISLAVSSFACLYHRLYLALGLYALGLVGYVITEVMANRRPSEEEK
ncbi:unnamed protein product, partial [Lymnaea stagnalis]